MTNDKFAFKDRSALVEAGETYSGLPGWKEAIYRFKKNKGAVVGLIFVLLIILLSVLVPVISPHSYWKSNIEMQNLPPRIPVIEKLGIFAGTRNGVNVYQQKGFDNLYFYFGTDKLGRDVFTRVFSGTRISLLVAVIAAAADMIIGVIYGLISGYYGGRLDMIMQRFIEIVHGIPNLVIVTMLMMVLKPGISSITIALLISGWIGMSRLIRAQTLKLKEREYILASRSLGTRKRDIIFKDILPNCMGQIIINTMSSIPSAIFMESYLSYIGLGIPAPRASLGVLISDGYASILMYPYLLIIPVAVFAVLMLSLNLFADGLRDALDPNMKDM